ncbi:hypothetical protein QVA66_05000 [Staphylococcus chromogenes]|nr:hypothetical protein [Staphylococcus chromogenes]
MNAILVAIKDPALHPEVMHIAAATGQQVVDALDTAEITRAARTAATVLVDVGAAPALYDLPPRSGVYLLASDPGPVDWKVAMRCGATDGFVIPAQSPDLLRQLGSAGQQQGSPSSRNCLGVVSAVGGAGASTIAASLAMTNKCPLIDADPYSGGLDLLIGAEHAIGARWGDINFASGALAAADVVHALPEAGGVPVLTSQRSGAVVPRCGSAEVLSALDSLWDRDVVVDMGSWGPLSAEVASACTSVLVVVPAEIRAVSVAAEIAAELRTHAATAQVSAVLRHRGWSGLDVEEAQRMCGLEFVGEVPHLAGVSKLAETTGLVKLPRGLKRLADQLVQEPRVWRC